MVRFSGRLGQALMAKRIEKIGNQRFGHLIDFSRPISVTVNKRSLSAYFGDTLYSALIANGFTEVIGGNGESISLNKSLPMFVRNLRSTELNAKILAADLVLHDGDALEVDFGALGLGRKILRFLRGQHSAPLGLNWVNNDHFDLPHAPTLRRKTVVIGGGISGMQAALHAAESGHSVLLLEKDQLLGGVCAYYGRAEGETEPELLINQLMQEVEASKRVNVFTGSTALDIQGKRILVQHSLFHEQTQRTELSWVHFDQLVIATGGEHHGFGLENHLPHRVLDSKEAFHDLWAYG